MTSVYNLLREACDISQAEAAERVHETRLDTVKSWSSDRRPAPQWAINQLQSLLRRIRLSGEAFAGELKGMIAAGYSVQIGLPANDADAHAHGFPSSAAALRAIAVALSLLPDDAQIRMVHRGQSPIVDMPKLDPDKVLPTPTDRQVLEEMAFNGPRGECLTVGNVNRRKYERLEAIGWVTHFCPNLNDVAYELTEAGSLELALIREAGMIRANPNPIPVGTATIVTGGRLRMPPKIATGKPINFAGRSYRVKDVEDEIVSVINGAGAEMVLSVPAELIG